jgi:hypothetical protein
MAVEPDLIASLVDQLGYQSIAVPQFHVMPVYELFGGFDRGDIFVASVRMLLRFAIRHTSRRGWIGEPELTVNSQNKAAPTRGLTRR